MLDEPHLHHLWFPLMVLWDLKQPIMIGIFLNTFALNGESHMVNEAVKGWLRASLTFAIIRATNLCLRGSRVKWRSALDMVDGIGLPSVQEHWQ